VWSGEEEAFEILLLWLARLDHVRGHDALIGEEVFEYPYIESTNSRRLRTECLNRQIPENPNESGIRKTTRSSPPVYSTCTDDASLSIDTKILSRLSDELSESFVARIIDNGCAASKSVENEEKVYRNEQLFVERRSVVGRSSRCF